MATIDGRVDMLKVREYNGDWWLFLEFQSGEVAGIARFPSVAAKKAFFQWHATRMAGILDEVLAVPGVADDRATKVALTKILTGADIGDLPET